MLKLKILNRLVSVLMLTITLNVLAETPDYITECVDCHGDKGVSQESDIPTIAGASEYFISDTLVAYQDGDRIAIESKFRQGDLSREPTDMQKIANELSEAQIEEISKYFSTQEFVAAKQKFDAALVARGEKIHRARCKKCHEDGGSSAEDDAGLLAGQWKPYLTHAFKLFRSGERTMDPKMKKKIDKLDDGKVEALLNYYASQQ